MAKSKDTTRDSATPADFTWINIGQPSEATSSKNRKRVRSYVTKLQHQRTRDRICKDAKPASSPATSSSTANATSSSASRETSTELETGHPLRAVSRRKRYENNVATSYGTALGSSELQTSPSPIPSEAGQDEIEAELVHGEARETQTIHLAHIPWESMAFRTFAMNDSSNIVGQSLDGLELDLSSVMGLYRNICKVQSQDYTQQYSLTRNEQAAGSRFYPYIFTDPVLLSTALLLGVRNQLDVLGRQLKGQTLTFVAHLEDFITRSINEALCDPDRGISNQMLMAVILCGAYEMKHGDPKRFMVHMNGLVRMIHMRGGLRAVADPDPYIARILLWIDTNTAKLAGSKGYLHDMSDDIPGGHRPQADTKVFRVQPTAEDST